MSKGGEGNHRREIGKEEGRSLRVKGITRTEDGEMIPEVGPTLKGIQEISQGIGETSQGIGDHS